MDIHVSPIVQVTCVICACINRYGITYMYFLSIRRFLLSLLHACTCTCILYVDSYSHY